MGFAISFSFAWRQLDDLIGFKNAMEEEGHDADEAILGYVEGRVSWIIFLKVETSCVDVSKACGLDGPWHFIVLQLGDLLFLALE